MSSEIKAILAEKMSDSRGNPTLRVEVETADGKFSAGVPSGASTGEGEAVALNADKAVENVNKIIAPELKGNDVADQEGLDRLMIEMDGTKDKSKLGANAILGVSLAAARAGAAGLNVPLWRYISSISGQKPFLSVPTFNIINGGAHAKNNLSLQEFMAVIEGGSPEKNLESGSAVYRELEKLIEEEYGREALVLGDEGGFAPPLSGAEEAIELILKAARKAGCEKITKIAVDAAASQFYKNGKYQVGFDFLDRGELLRYYMELADKYPIVSLEDPFQEEDWQGFIDIQKEIGDKVIIVGDDLLVSNSERIKEAEEKKACNGLILKVNQVGTLSEGIEAGKLAKSFGWKVIVSHRSGETEDDFIADLAVGLGANYLKSGAPATEFRMAKYKRLLKITEEM
ncbi:MAG: enolase [Candidatus Paceibacterota bacterium]|jgi:enolase|nr:enolase [Candidatus Paceibacterota bacterium]